MTLGIKRSATGLAVLGTAILVVSICLPTPRPERALAATCAAGQVEEVKLGIVVAKGCFTKKDDSKEGEYYESSGTEVKLNGFTVKPEDGAPLYLYTGNLGKAGTGARRVTTLGRKAAVSVSYSVGTAHGNFGWVATHGLDFNPPAKGELPMFEGAMVAPVTGFLFDVIPLMSSSSVVEINEHGGGSFDVHMALASILQLKKKASGAIALGFEVDEHGKVEFEGVEGEAEGVPISKIAEIEDIALKLRTSPSFALDASAALILKVPERVKGKGLGATFGLNEHGPTKFGVSLLGANLQLGSSGVYLQKLGLTLFFQPFGFGGQAALTAGPEVRIFGQKLAAAKFDGTLDLRFPDEQSKAHGYLDTKAAAKLINLPVANASFRYDFGQGTKFGAAIGIGIPSLTNNPNQPLYAGARVDGWTTASHFNLEGWGTVRAFGVVLAGAKVVASDVGLAGCVEAWWGAAGAGVYWSTGNFGGWVAWTCDLGSYAGRRSAVARFADGAEQAQVRIPKKAVLVSIDGGESPPMLALEHPDGRTLSTPPVDDPDGQVVLDHGTTFAEHDGGDSVHFMPRRTGGQWTLRSLDGSPVEVDSIRIVEKAPEPRVRARLRGKGLKRTLVWHAKEIPHQSLVFSEVLPDGSEAGLFRTRQPSGKRVVSLAQGGRSYGSRKLSVDVRQRFDTPREELIADRYRVERPRRLPAPRRVRAERQLQDLLVSWRKVEGARAYRVVASDPKGVSTTRIIGRQTGRALLESVPTRSRLRVSVAAINVDGSPGRPGRAAVLDTDRLVPGPKPALRGLLREARIGSRRGGRVVTHPECPWRGSCTFRLVAIRGTRVVGRATLRLPADMTDRLTVQLRGRAKPTSWRATLHYRGEVHRRGSGHEAAR